MTGAVRGLVLALHRDGAAFSGRAPLPAVRADAGAAVARGAELQPVDLQHLGGEDGEVVLGGERFRALIGRRERGAGRGGREVVTGCGRLLHALPDGVDLGAAGLHRHQGAHAQLPFQAVAPEDEQGLGVVREFEGFGAAVVGEGGEGLLRGVGGAQDHGAGVGFSVRGGGGQDGGAPGVVAVVGGAGQVVPDGLAEGGGGHGASIGFSSNDECVAHSSF